MDTMMTLTAVLLPILINAIVFTALILIIRLMVRVRNRVSVVKDPDEAEEGVQDAFLKAYSALDSFRQKSKFSTWLYKIVVNEGLKNIMGRSSRII